MSREACEFVDMSASATYRELFEVSTVAVFGYRNLTNPGLVRFHLESPPGTSSVVPETSQLDGLSIF